MKRFRFPLRPVAILRAHREQQAQQALAAALGLLRQAEVRLTEVQARGAELERTIAEARGQGFRCDLQVAFLAAYRRERQNEAEAGRQVEAARLEAERRRKAALQAHREVKIIASLEERAQARHRAEGFRVEQNEFDERAASRAGRAPATL